MRVACKPTLQPRIRASAFMVKRAAGVPPTEIPDEEQMVVVRFLVCPSCGELGAEPYARVAEGKIVCAACSGYPR